MTTAPPPRPPRARPGPGRGPASGAFIAGLCLLLVAAVASVVSSVGVLGGESATASAPDPCGPGGNTISCENSLPGSPRSEWDVDGAGDPTIQGFATDISTDVGGTVSFKVDTDAAAYRVDIYRLGFYAGLGARRVASLTPSAPLPQRQPSCIEDVSVGLYDCGDWGVSASWAVPQMAVSGIYLARLVRADTGGASLVQFVVRDDDSHSELLFQTSDTAWQAYNDYGGRSLYQGGSNGRAYKVSYNRPLVQRGGTYARATMFNDEYPMLRWLEANGYDVSYSTGVDTDRRGGELLEHRTFMSVGHDEYWSASQRAHVEAARVAGVNLAFFSGNEMFWKTRWENSIDGTGTDHRTLVSYKETQADAKIDPQSQIWTGTWRDARFSPPADGGRPENALSGTIFMVNCCRFDPVTVSSEEGQMRLWRNTSFARLPPGGVGRTVSGIVGYEWDEDLDNGARPPGLIRLSTTTVEVPSLLADDGDAYRPGTATHSLTYYRASSGAKVFSAGTVQWSWGLDTTHDNPANVPLAVDPDVKQATVNVLADMGSQPTTLEAGLVAGTESTDTRAPTSTLTSAIAGTTVVAGGPVTLDGTAADAGGGQVGGVEVSVDGGDTWHRAEGRSTWTYTWTPDDAGVAAIRTRATDDSGNIERPGSPVSVSVAPRTCPCTLLGDAVPPVEAGTRAAPVELGLRFTSDVAGEVTGVRFYKSAGNTGRHTGSLWTAGGRRLATVTFTGESASGWQTASFARPVPIAAGTTYVVSYHAPSGRFSRDVGAFYRAGIDTPPLHAAPQGPDGAPGVFRYGSGGGFPSQSYKATNYFVDVVLDRTRLPK